MPLQSTLLKDNTRLQRCLVSDPAHVLPRERGAHVGLIQQALQLVDAAALDPDELRTTFYGTSTAQAVLAFKTKREIVNKAYQSQPDNIVGKMTIQALDTELCGLTPPAPNPGKRHVKFVPPPPRSEVIMSVRGSFTPLGPVFNGNGFDSDPFGDNNQRVPNETFQMLPANGGTRRTRIRDDGFAEGRPNLRFELTGASGTTNLDSVLRMEEVDSGSKSIREILLTGRGPGAALLKAINVSSGAAEATLQIAALAPKEFTVGFIVVHDSKGVATPQGSIEQFLEKANLIWSSQANITLRSVGVKQIRFEGGLLGGLFGGDTFPTKHLLRESDGHRSLARERLGAADRYIYFVHEIDTEDGSLNNGLTGEVMYIAKRVGFDWRTFAHEFGHSIGRKHSEARDVANLMSDGRTETILQTTLNKTQIVQSNLKPGTWLDAVA